MPGPAMLDRIRAAASTQPFGACFGLSRMQKIFLTLFSMLLFSGGLTARAISGSERTEKVSGAIVAYYQGLFLLPCYHICGGSLIVRIGKPNEDQPRYIRIDFRYPNGHFPNELIESNILWTFRLTRTKSKDDPIEKYIKTIDEKTAKELDAKIPAWKLVSGAENEELPFGKVVPSYELNEDVQKLIRRKLR
jgi:hypothetical protein